MYTTFTQLTGGRGRMIKFETNLVHIPKFFLKRHKEPRKQNKKRQMV